ncbi:hypothetical protein FKM82_009410 [Ascaphus truei]
MAVAKSNPILDMQEELTCAICLDYFKEPVSIECGHSFCQTCISRTWRGLRNHFPCPQCRNTSKWMFLRSNRVLENMVDISNRLQADRKSEGDKRRKCEKHQEPMKLYCQVDKKEICLVCRESVDHRTHTVIPVEESTNEFKAKLGNRLDLLKKEVADIVRKKNEEEEKSQLLQNKVVQKRRLLTSEFEALQQLLADRQRALTDRLGEMEKTIMQRRNENMTRLNEKLSSLQKLIVDIEKNGFPSTWQIHQKPSGTVSSHAQVLQSPMPTKGIHSGNLDSSTRDYLMQFTVSVTVNHRTANPNLSISGNKKIIKYETHPRDLIPYPERFNMKPFVLGNTGYKSGKRYWEVEVGRGAYWSVGVAMQSVQRKGSFKVEPKGGIWAIGLLGMDNYLALTNPDTVLNDVEPPVRIGVFLNMDEEWVGFYNADSMEFLYTFDVPGTGRLLPFFCVGALGTELRLVF